MNGGLLLNRKLSAKTKKYAVASTRKHSIPAQLQKLRRHSKSLTGQNGQIRTCYQFSTNKSYNKAKSVNVKITVK